METKTIQSWIQRKVRIKKEYIKTELDIDEDASTYDDDGNIVEEVYLEYEYIDTQNGMRGVFQGHERDIFIVVSDCYGVDLYKARSGKVDVDKLPEPTHQIMIKRELKTSRLYEAKWDYYEFLWDSKYFEVVTTETIYVTDNEFNK
jgi:hypothetical protein